MKLKVISTGHETGTRVENAETGEEIEGITSVTFCHVAAVELPTLRVEVRSYEGNVQVEAIGEGTIAEVHPFQTGGRHPREERPYRLLSEFREAGLLWLINRTVFHPRGYALAFKIDGHSGDIVGWNVQGDGSEVFGFSDEDDDESFADVKRFFESLS